MMDMETVDIAKAHHPLKLPSLIKAKPKSSKLVTTTNNVSVPESVDLSSSTFNLDDIPFDDILSAMMSETENEEELIFAEKGYRRITDDDLISVTLQGHLFESELITLSPKGVRVSQPVMMKRIDKELSRQKVAVQDNISFCVEEDVVKEAIILRHLTLNLDSQPTGDCMIKFIDFFGTSSHWYLVTERIESAVSLKDFVHEAHEYMDADRLPLEHWKNVCKSMLWQLTATLHYLHNVCRCKFCFRRTDCTLLVVPTRFCYHPQTRRRAEPGDGEYHAEIGHLHQEN